MCSAKGRRRIGGRSWGKRCALICLWGTILSLSVALAELGPEDVLILVNENSPTSRYIAKIYVEDYHPEIEPNQILHLSGLTDCSGPSATAADEIITRDQYEQLIAQPVRDYLSDSNHPDRITQIKVIITTAGMPYRIEDTNYSDAINPAGSDPDVVSGHTSEINAASVESELVGLWYGDYGSNPFGLGNRLVNPYQGYRYSGIELFERVVPGTKSMIWSLADTQIGPRPKMEGEMEEGPFIYGTINRSFNAGDMYLTCRLDGPKNQNKSAVFAVRAMLERAKRASNPAIGVNPLQAVAVFDDVPSSDTSSDFDDNRVFNLSASVNYWVYDPNLPQPPNAPYLLKKDDYVAGFRAMTNEAVNYDGLNTGLMASANDLCVILDRRSGTRTNQADLDALLSTYPQRIEGQAAILLATYGYNGDESSTGNYMFEEGPGGGVLFNLVNGAVFTSIESLNAVTMFSDVDTSPVAQGKIVDFIEIGGTAALGHSFEPRSTAAIDNLFLFYNLMADEDGDGFADLTFIEAAFTAIPFLSWSEVVIGDPLMRIAYGPGQKAWKTLQGDVSNNGLVSTYDMILIRKYLGGQLEFGDEAAFEKYYDLADVSQNGLISTYDMIKTRQNLGATADW